MAEIYLMHYRHGVKIATMELEAQYDEQNGWVRFDPDEIVAPVDDLPESTAEANVMAEAPRRRGRPRKDD
jgi:hypothetical protein